MLHLAASAFSCRRIAVVDRAIGAACEGNPLLSSGLAGACFAASWCRPLDCVAVGLDDFSSYVFDVSMRLR